MSNDQSVDAPKALADFPAAPLTLEGFSILHQMFRLSARSGVSCGSLAARDGDDAVELFDKMAAQDGGPRYLPALGTRRSFPHSLPSQL